MHPKDHHSQLEWDNGKLKLRLKGKRACRGLMPFQPYFSFPITGSKTPLGVGRWARDYAMLCYTASVVPDSLWPHGLVAHQAAQSMGFSRHEYWSGLPCPSLGDLPDPGIEPASPALARGFFVISTTWKAHNIGHVLMPLDRTLQNG